MNAAASLRQMRIIHLVFIIASILYAYSAEFVVKKGEAGVQAAMIEGIVCAAGFDVLIAYYFRRTKLYPALEKLHLAPSDPEALKNWRFSTLLTMALVLPIAIYGFVLRFLGAPRNVAVSFYSAALILLVVWRPKLELRPEKPGLPGNQ